MLKNIGLFFMVLEFGEAKTKIQAKHNAANKIMQLIKDASSTNTNLNEIQHDCLVKCNEWSVYSAT